MEEGCGGLHRRKKSGKKLSAVSYQPSAETRIPLTRTLPKELRLLARNNGEGTLLKADSPPNKNPPDACLGRARVSIRWATVSPYSPCCFQEYVKKIKHPNPPKLRLFL